MKDYHVKIFYSEEDEGYIAEIPDLKYCSAFGETPVEALEELEVAKKLWLEVAKAKGKNIPKPKYKPSVRKEETELLKYLQKAGISDKEIVKEIHNIFEIATSMRIKKRSKTKTIKEKVLLSSKGKKSNKDLNENYKTQKRKILKEEIKEK